MPRILPVKFVVKFGCATTPEVMLFSTEEAVAETDLKTLLMKKHAN